MTIGNLDNLNLAYAMTVHKAQGGQCEAAIMPLTTSHTHMLERSILYTGITRAMEALLLMGQEQALERACRNEKGNNRLTTLPHRIAKHAPTQVEAPFAGTDEEAEDDLPPGVEASPVDDEPAAMAMQTGPRD